MSRPEFLLEEVSTADNIMLQGIVSIPQKSTHRILVWVHGLTGTFYGNLKLLKQLAEVGEREGLAVASFNTRGHDMIAGLRRLDPGSFKGYTHAMGGAGYERFEDCVFDIDAVVQLLASRGYSDIVLVGHSTGANKVCYYAGENPQSAVKGIILSSPMSDRLAAAMEDTSGKTQDIEMMRDLVESGEGDSLVVGKHFFPLTPRRYLSLYTPGNEDMFDYDSPAPQMPHYSAVTLPLLVVLAEKDEVADRPIEAIQSAFDSTTRSKNYSSVIIPDAYHSFSGKESKFVQTIVEWSIRLK